VSAYVELLVKGALDRIPLSGEKVAIGQSPSNDIPLPFDPTVSRLHAVLESLPSGWCIRDLNSRNGTFLNGERIWGERPLRPGDEVRLGQTTLLFRVEEPVEPGGGTVGAEKPPELTRREREVLLSLCAPLMSGDTFREPASIRQIAQMLFVGDAAVKQHLRRLYDKFGVGDQGEHRRVRLANEALRQGAVSMAQIRDWVKRKESRQG
jgi:pSer/pThr/pTyr-binding forkhead associated (FHA) protein